MGRAGASLIEVADGADGRLDAAAAILAALGERWLTRLFCEGGGGLAAAFLSAGFVDRLAGFVAELALGADRVRRLSDGALAEAPRLRWLETQEVGGDVLQLWEPVELGPTG